MHKKLDQKFPMKALSGSKQPWSKAEIATLIYSVMRLGEKEFADVLGPTIFMKREHELK